MVSGLGLKFFFFVLIFSFSIQAQVQVVGQVLSANDSLPIFGASVYFDGTSIGMSSGEDGRFKLITESSISSPLIVTALGHQIRVFQPVLGDPDLGIIYLEESQESLGVVHLEADPWSREKKLEIFRREFLGNTAMAMQSKIKNEEALSLRYIPSTETLLAYADAPLTIVNKHLGYEVTYNLTDFKVDFSSSGGFRLTTLVYYEGYSFFKELDSKPRKRYLKNRENIYKGSSLHFMRSLAEQKLTENGFRIFLKGWEVLPYSYFKIKNSEGLTEVELLEEKITLVFGPLLQSDIHKKGKFYIDSHGNFTPPQNVIFSGEMSKLRVAGMLPLNYKL